MEKEKEKEKEDVEALKQLSRLFKGEGSCSFANYRDLWKQLNSDPNQATRFLALLIYKLLLIENNDFETSLEEIIGKNYLPRTAEASAGL